MSYQISPSCQIKNLNNLYEEYFGYRENGLFVEIGASDGYSHSNTWGLAKAGWRGVYAEPLPNMFEKCAQEHVNNRVVAFNIAIGNRIGKTKLYLGPFPTINEETVDKNPWDCNYDRNSFIEVDVLTLDSLLYAVFPKLKLHEIDLLVIDVEGAELEVLEGFSINLFLPKMVIIESCEGHPEKKKTFHTDQILEYFKNAPYSKIQADGINTVFVLEELQWK